MICKCKQHLALLCITLVSDPIILSYYKCKLCSLHTEGREIIISLPSTVVYARSYQPTTHEQICHSTAVGRYGRASTTVDGSRNDNVFTFCEERVPVQSNGSIHTDKIYLSPDIFRIHFLLIAAINTLYPQNTRGIQLDQTQTDLSSRASF